MTLCLIPSGLLSKDWKLVFTSPRSYPLFATRPDICPSSNKIKLVKTFGLEFSMTFVPPPLSHTLVINTFMRIPKILTDLSFRPMNPENAVLQVKEHLECKVSLTHVTHVYSTAFVRFENIFWSCGLDFELSWLTSQHIVNFLNFSRYNVVLAGTPT